MVRSKKAAATADPAGDVVPSRKNKGDWESSSTNERHLAGMRADGRLPATESAKIRCVGNEVIPNPRAGERVAFVDFVTRGYTFLSWLAWIRLVLKLYKPES